MLNTSVSLFSVLSKVYYEKYPSEITEPVDPKD